MPEDKALAVIDRLEIQQQTAIIKRKEGHPFKYSRPDGSLDTQRIADIIDCYFDNKDRQAQEAKRLKDSISEDRDLTYIKGTYSLAGIALALNIDMETLWLWGKGLTAAEKYDEHGNDISVYNHELSNSIKKAKLRVMEWITELSDSQRQSKDIFLLKNWFGMRDVQEIDQRFTGNITIEMGDWGKRGD